jgi:hypothetical protein
VLLKDPGFSDPGFSADMAVGVVFVVVGDVADGVGGLLDLAATAEVAAEAVLVGGVTVKPSRF